MSKLSHTKKVCLVVHLHRMLFDQKSPVHAVPRPAGGNKNNQQTNFATQRLN